MSAEPVLVPVAASSTLRETVAYAVESALDATDASGDGDVAETGRAAPDDTGRAAPDDTGRAAPDESRDGGAPGTGDGDLPEVHFVYVHAPREFDPDGAGPALDDAAELLERVAVWAEEDAGDEDAVTVTTAHCGEDEYLFSPVDVARTLLDAAEDVGAGRIVLDPEYDPGIGAPFLRPLESELASAGGPAVETAPVQSRVRRPPIVRAASPRRIAAVVGVSFVFYQVLGGSLAPFDLVTGAVTATIVAVALSRVAIGRDPSLRRTPARIARGTLFVPYLLWEILKANVAVAAVILDPRGSVDPRLTRIEPSVYGALPVTSLANSITLTPGTLTVRVEDNELLIHTLLAASREDLFEGGLERGIRFVFYGRHAMRTDALDERGDAEVLEPGALGAAGGRAAASGGEEA